MKQNRIKIYEHCKKIQALETDSLHSVRQTTRVMDAEQALEDMWADLFECFRYLERCEMLRTD